MKLDSGFKLVMKSGSRRLFATLVKPYDVVITGCGAVGLSIACALSQSPHFQASSPLSVLLIDQVPALPKMESFCLQGSVSPQEVIPNQRVYTLNPGSIDFLREIGVFELFEKERIVDFHAMQIWEQWGSGHVALRDPLNRMGIVIENDHLVAAMHEKLRSSVNFDILLDSKIEAMQVFPDSVHMEIKNKKKNESQKVEASLVIGSDGRNSFVKKNMGIAEWGWNYNQFGIVCTLETAYRNTTAWQRFLLDGPVAVLPLWDRYSSLVWTVGREEHDVLMGASEEEFVRRLNEALHSASLHSFPDLSFWSERSSFEEPPFILKTKNRRLSFPLSLLQAKRYVGERVALAGDAAHGNHPLAGQGLNMGFVDAQILSRKLLENVQDGSDLGSLGTLEAYEAESKIANYTMSATIDVVKRLYQGSDPLKGTIRNFGTIFTNASPLKDLMKLGASGRLFMK